MPTPLVLTSIEVSTVVAPPVAPTLVVEPIRVVSPSVPAPTLDAGRPV